MPYSPPLRLCIMLAVAITLTLSCTDSPKFPAPTGRVNDLANIPPTVPALTGLVNDFANVLTDIERDTLEQDLIQFKNSSGAILVFGDGEIVPAVSVYWRFRKRALQE